MEDRREKRSGKEWIKTRHKVIYALGAPIVRAICKLIYPGLELETFPEGRTRNYLILYNHQTPMDQFFISLIPGQPVYHVATEDIMSNGWISRLLAWAVAPIPILKQMKDMRAMRNCVAVAKQGGTLALAPEGNRTFSGRTTHFAIGVVKLIKLLKLPVAAVRIEGGYGVEPRWSGGRRRGRIHVGVARVLEPEEYRELTDEDLYGLLKELLRVDESVPGGEYRSGKSAEYLERLFYVCPKCGFSTFLSRGDTVICTRCGEGFRYGEHKELSDISGRDRTPASIGEWYDLQEAYVNSIDPFALTEKPLFEDKVSVSEVRLYDRKIPLNRDARAKLFGDRIELSSSAGEMLMELSFDDTDTVTVLGKKKLNVYCGGRVIQLAGDDRFNAIKYVNLFYRFKNVQKEKNGGTEGVKFLGL